MRFTSDLRLGRETNAEWASSYSVASASRYGRSARILADWSALHGAYRYMNWLLMVPMLVTEIVFAMELTPAEEPTTGSKHGAASAL